MEITAFKTTQVDGDDNVMEIDPRKMRVYQIKFNRLSREISVVYTEPKKKKRKK